MSLTMVPPERSGAVVERRMACSLGWMEISGAVAAFDCGDLVLRGPERFQESEVSEVLCL